MFKRAGGRTEPQDPEEAEPAKFDGDERSGSTPTEGIDHEPTSSIRFSENKSKTKGYKVRKEKHKTE